MRNGSIEGGLLVHPVVNPKEANKTNQNLSTKWGKNQLTLDVLTDK